LDPYKNTTFTLPCSLPVTWADGEVDILGIHITEYINNLSTRNFNRKPVKIDKILQPIPVYLWKNCPD
jgi:hypothetical protein